jgi:large subunit ribosomal protein L6
MSRVAKNPIAIPAGVTVNIVAQEITIKSSKATVQHKINNYVKVSQEANALHIAAQDSSSKGDAAAGTTRAVLNNIVTGVTHGFERKLELVGVGYRAQAQGKNLNLTLGFSHPVVHPVPEGITVETPTQTEIIIKGFDKQQVTQEAAKIRAYRSPEPYKGKGVRYAGEKIILKETKKK